LHKGVKSSPRDRQKPGEWQREFSLICGVCVNSLQAKPATRKVGLCFQELFKRAHKYRYMGVEDCFIESTDNPFSEQPISQMKIVKDLLGTMSRTWKATKYREINQLPYR
jgi:hypothetical protein